MGILRWLVRKLFTGEVVHDYGTLGALSGMAAPGEMSLLLCKRGPQLQLVFRTSTRFELNWYPVNVSAELAAKLAEVAEDVRKAVAADALDGIPETRPHETTTNICERDHRPFSGGARRPAPET